MKNAFSVTPSKDVKKAKLLAAEWKQRSEKIQAQVAYEAARFVLDGLLTLIPKSEDGRRYAAALRIARIRSKDPAFAVMLSMRARKTKRIDGPKTIFYVKAKTGPKKPSKVVEILERYSPWTLDTLPFQPADKDAHVLSVRVSEKDVHRVFKDRQRDEKKWRVELERVGVRVKASKMVRDRRVRAIPDVALVGYRIEFGSGSIRPKPHWRPSLRNLKTVGVRKIARMRTMANALTQLGYKGWKRWPSRVPLKIGTREAGKFRAFQKRLKIR